MAATRGRAATMAMAVGLLLAACSGSSDAAAPETTTTVATTTAGSATTTPKTCSAADPADLAVIEAALSDGADHLGEAHALDGGRYGYRLIAANTYDASGARTSSSDVWVISGDVLFALSDGARASSDLPDGRELGLSADNADAVAVIRCVEGG